MKIGNQAESFSDVSRLKLPGQQLHFGLVLRPNVLRPFCFNAPFQFTPLLNLHSLIFGVMPFAWLRSVKADTHMACRAHAVPLPCRATKGLDCVFPIWFTQCGRVWFALAMPCQCHAPTMFFSRPQHSTAVSRRLCCVLEKNGMVRAWHGHGMASANQTRPQCVNQMGKTHSKPLAARHGRGTSWARHAMCESAFTLTPCVLFYRNTSRA